MALPSKNLLPIPSLQFFDANGSTLAAGYVYTYDADGLTPKATYQDPFGASANQNPIPLDAAGRAVIYGTGEYVWRVTDMNGVEQYTQPSADPTDILQISAAMLPVIQATTTAAALALLGGSAAGSSVPVGLGPLPWSGPSAPTGWLLCYGQAISRTTYSALFAVMGTTYGAGDGSTTFNVPDMRGRAAAGADAMGGTAANRLTSASLGASAVPGAAGGNENYQQHTHTYTDPGHQHNLRESISYNTSATPDYAAAGDGNHTPNNVFGAVLPTTIGITIDNAGTGTSQNVQPTLVTNYIVFAGV